VAGPGAEAVPGGAQELAQVRRLLVPVLQVNIADKQVNVAAPASAVPGD
jgi:hypothetical protein